MAENKGRHLCECGCGVAITLRAEHFNNGVPRYRHGHNPQRKRPPSPMRTCECGCGTIIKAVSDNGLPRRFVSGHNARGQHRSPETIEKLRRQKLGERNPMHGKTPHNFKGRTVTEQGYVLVFSPNHPFATKSSGKGVMEHRLVMEEHLRQTDPASPHLIDVGGVLYLRRDIEVHHIDGVKDNNVVENLRPMTKSEHAALHQAERR